MGKTVIISDFVYSFEYGGCISVLVDGHEAHIEIQKNYSLINGFVIINILYDEVTIKLFEQGTYIVYDDHLLRIAREAHRRLGEGTFVEDYKPLVKAITVTLEDY